MALFHPVTVAGKYELLLLSDSWPDAQSIVPCVEIYYAAGGGFISIVLLVVDTFSSNNVSFIFCTVCGGRKTIVACTPQASLETVIETN